jgi:protein-S-isoprenylcysteine O-methyltransferase Ste14
MMRTLSILGFAGMVAGIPLLFRLDALLGEEPVAITVQVLAVALMVWARIVFGRRSFHAAGNPTEGGLVTSGPYRYIRHPIYAAVLYVVWAGVLSHLSARAVLCGLLVTAGAGVRIYVEERLLVEKYPEYRAYAGRTRRIIPFVM